MSPHPDRPGPVSTAIDFILVVIILGCGGVLLWTAAQVAVRTVRAAARLRRLRRWPKGRGR